MTSKDTNTPTGQAAEKPFGWRFTLPLLLGSTLNPINSSMIATGLVSIAADFHTGPGATATLVSVLYLCSAVMQPTMGKLSTLFGPRRIFLVGVFLLLVGGAIGAIAPSFGVLLISRALIGIGTSAGYPTAMALVRRRADRFDIGVPSRVLGNFSIAAQITVVVGLPIGGVLAGAFGWRALFLVNVPLALITLGFAFFGVTRDDPIPRRGLRGVIAAIDFPGIALFAASIVSLLVFLSSLTAPIWWLLPVVVVLLAGLILWERRAAQPLIDVRMLAKNAPLQRTYVRQMLVGLGTYTCLYGASQWLEESAHYSPFTVGLILLPLSGLSIVIARIASSRGWIRWPLVIGAVALILSGVVMLFVDSSSSVLILIGMTLLFGLTNGLSGFANQAALYIQAPGATIAVASGLYRTFSYIGAIFSSTLIGIAFGAAVTDAGFHRLAWVVLGIGAASLVLTAIDRRLPVTAARAA
ncbi:MFS transporter [Leifsonia sp. NPDC058230]|uniref:MFS transporter n=1 Tax=Leifsonia sp. NPDC058230 TaxID=3346391 RepID=UPI0036D988BF